MRTAGEKHLYRILSARIGQVYKLGHPGYTYVMAKVFYLTFWVSGFEVNASSFEPSACNLCRIVNHVDWPSQLVLLSHPS